MNLLKIPCKLTFAASPLSRVGNLTTAKTKTSRSHYLSVSNKRFYSLGLYCTSIGVVTLVGAAIGHITAYRIKKIWNSELNLLRDIKIREASLVSFAYLFTVIGGIAGFFIGLLPYLVIELKYKNLIPLSTMALKNHELHDLYTICSFMTALLFGCILLGLLANVIVKDTKGYLEFILAALYWALLLFIFVRLCFLIVITWYSLWVQHDYFYWYSLFQHLVVMSAPLADVEFSFYTLHPMVTSLYYAIEKASIYSLVSEWVDKIPQMVVSSDITAVRDFIYTGYRTIFKVLPYLSYVACWDFCVSVVQELSPFKFLTSGPFSKPNYGPWHTDFVTFFLQGMASIKTLNQLSILTPENQLHVPLTIDFLRCFLDLLSPALYGEVSFRSPLSSAYSYVFAWLGTQYLFFWWIYIKIVGRSRAYRRYRIKLLRHFKQF